MYDPSLGLCISGRKGSRHAEGKGNCSREATRGISTTVNGGMGMLACCIRCRNSPLPPTRVRGCAVELVDGSVTSRAESEAQEERNSSEESSIDRL